MQGVFTILTSGNSIQPNAFWHIQVRHHQQNNRHGITPLFRSTASIFIIIKKIVFILEFAIYSDILRLTAVEWGIVSALWQWLIETVIFQQIAHKPTKFKKEFAAYLGEMCR